MSTGTHHIDVSPARRFGAPQLALALAIISLPGSLLPWDWFAMGGLVIGVPLAVAAIAVVVLLIPVVWIVASALG